MANVTFNIAQELYKEAYPALASKRFFRIEPVNDAISAGIDRLTGNVFEASPAKSPEPELRQLNFSPELPAQQETALRSYLGTPIFFPILFKGGQYDYYENGQIVQKQVDEWLLPPTSIAEFTRGKLIKKTTPNARRGSVKELWAFEDWNIVIRGLLIADNAEEFPASHLEALSKFEQAADSIEVLGDLFTVLGIQRIVIMSISISQVKGKPNVIPFQINAVSDEDLELIAK